MGRMKPVTKTRRVAKTRQVPGMNGGFATEVYYEEESYTVNEYVSGPDSYGPDNSASCGSAGGE